MSASARREKIVTLPGSSKKYAIVPASSKTLLSRDEMRSISRVVSTTAVSAANQRRRADLGPDGTMRVSRRIPELPFERVMPNCDEALELRVHAIRSQEPALDVPLRFAAPEEYHLPPMDDPPLRLSLSRRIGALIKGGDSVSVSWANARVKMPPGGGAAYLAGEGIATTIKDMEARAQSSLRNGNAAQAANLFTCLAALYYNHGNMESAIGAFESALPLFASIESAKGVAFCHNMCGMCYSRLGEHKMALIQYKKQEALGAAYVRCISQINMGVMYAAENELQYATRALTDALGSAHEAEESMLVTIALGNLGIVSLRDGNMRAAQGYLEECLEQCSLAGDKSGAAVCLLLLGQVYARIHDHAHAAFYYEHAYRVAGEANLPEIVSIARVNYGSARGSAALRDTVLAEASAMGKGNQLEHIINALPR